MKSIKFKMWANMMTVVAVLITVIWLFFLIFLQNFYEFTKETEVKKSQKLYISMLEKAEDMGKAYDEIIKIGRKSDSFVEIYDNNKKLVFSPLMYVSDNELFGRRVSSNDMVTTYAMPSIIQSMEENRQSTHTLKLKPRNSDDVSTIVLINAFENDNRTYYIASRAALIPVHDTRLIFNRFFILLSMIFILVAVALSFVFAEYVTKPISRISQAAKEVSRGNYDVVIPSTGRKDKMSMLTDDFNNMTKELTKVDTLRKDLLANVSHELKTPLTMIKGYAETIRDLTGDNPEKREKQLDIIIDESDRLTTLIGNVLDLSKLQAGKADLTAEVFNLSEKLSEVMPRYEIFKEKGYEFDINIQPDVIVKGNPMALEQVLCNLIDNAINHSDFSKPVKISLEKTNIALFTVTNYGDIIEEQNINHIWDRYYRIDKSGKRRVTGTGLGLSIVKEILTAHGADFGVTSSAEGGTRFWFKLPLDNTKDI